MWLYSEARQNISKLLEIAQKEEVEIRRRNGTIFSITTKKAEVKSPFAVSEIKTKIKTQDILDTIKNSREG